MVFSLGVRERRFEKGDSYNSFSFRNANGEWAISAPLVLLCGCFFFTLTAQDLLYSGAFWGEGGRGKEKEQ